MNLLNQSLQVLNNLKSLGQTRLMVLGAVGVVSMVLILGAAIFVNKPTYETLYVGLENSDLNKISIALAESGLDFNVGSDGATIQVPVGMTGKARVLLAERGLPDSTNAGYELFDNVGSLGLTSFMQEVTRVRALEGEIGRSIQQISGIAAARVHIVMPDVGNFRRGEQKPTASVMIRASASAGRKASASIRHLVAAAVPGLEVEDVTILDSTGQLLAAGDEGGNGAATRSLGIVQSVQQEIETSIDKALAPFLGMDNFRSSVTAQLNTDSQQIQETVFDPESRVERSVRTTKEAQKSQERQADTAATVEQNVPQAAPQGGGGGGPESSDESDKKEEQTNYEINSKTTATVRNGYQIEKVSVAVVVNRGRIARMVGEPADQAKIDAYLAEMQKIVSSAAGISQDRGDVITITAMDFLETQLLDEAPTGPGVMEVLQRNSATIINALAFVAVAFLVIWLGVRPAVRSIAGNGGAGELAAGPAGLELPDFAPAGGATGGALMDGFGADFGFDSNDDLFDTEDPNGGFNRRVREGPERRLSRMVEINEERAAKILRKWAIDKAA